MKHIILLLLVFSLLTCKEEEKENKATNTQESPQKDTVFDDSDYVLNANYEIGDVRRYGIFPDSTFISKHPFTKESKMKTVLDIAENSGIEISFPEGYYKMDLILDSRKNLKLRFDKSEFNLVHITQRFDSLPKPSNIELAGTLIIYDRLGLTEARNIKMDSIILKSNKKKNLRGMRNRGCHIYHGSKNLSINYLEIEDFGSGDVKYQHNHAALAIDGWNNNPENVQIKEIYIKSTDRHGIYITGKDHIIGKVTIDKFGVGSSADMSGMQDTSKGEEKEFKALWVNKCYDSFIENITINEKGSKGKYTAYFESGDIKRPFTIGTFKVINDNPNMSIFEEPNNGVIVELQE